MKKIGTLIIFISTGLLFFMSANAQQKNITLSGAIKDSATKTPLADASVNIINIATSETTNAVSDNSGNFTIKNIHPGNYQLKITYTGYKAFIKDDINLAGNMEAFLLSEVFLSPQQNVLQNVTIASSIEKPLISLSANKITLNVAQNPVASINNAYDILLQAPGVMEQDNTLRFRARSVSILIDGKLTNLRGEDLKNMLSSMPGSNIDKIEIVPNPSAKYGADGGSVINIKLAKNKNFGTSGTILAGIGTGRFANYNSGLNLNYRNKKINIFSNYYYEYNKQYSSNHSDRTLNFSSHIVQDEYGINIKKNNAYRAGIDYDINKNNLIGIEFNGHTDFQKRYIDNHSVLTNGITASDTSSSVITNGNSVIFNPSVNLYYKAVLDSLGRELSVNADYFTYNKKWEDNFLTNYFDQDNLKYKQTTFLRDNSPSHNSIKSLSMDYSYPSKVGNFEAGIKTVFTITDNNIQWQSQTNGDWINDSSKTNHFVYKENINAAYLTFEKAFKQNWELNLGIRAEQTNSTGTLINSGEINKKNYINFFPNVSVQYLKNLNNIFSFSYRKSIDRFGFDIVNPFIKYQSQYSFYRGNPDIAPQINHNIEFSFAYKQSLVFGLSETHSLNALGPVYLKSGSNSTISSYTNFKSADLFYIYSYYRKQFIKRLITILIGGFGFYRYNTATSTSIQQSNNSTWSYLFQTNNTLILKKGWAGDFNASYQGPLASGIYKLGGILSSSMGISKQILKDKAAIKLSITDLFNTQSKMINIDYQGVVMEQQRKEESRFIRLNITYRIGNKNVRSKKERTSKIEEVENRMTQ